MTTAAATGPSPRQRQVGDKVYAVATATLFLLAIVISIYGHLAFNGRIYAYFASLSNAHVDIFNRSSLAQWQIPWNYLDFTPFNLLLYKCLFFGKAASGGVAFRAYQFLYLFLALYCVRHLAQRALLTHAQEVSLILLTALNLPLYLVLISTSEDKVFYYAIPLAIVTLGLHTRFQALVTGIWAGWSGLGLFFLPVSAVYYARTREKKWLLFALLGGGALLAILPFFPESRVMLSNRSVREASPPFWFSIWRLIGPIYTPALNKLCMLLYAAAVWLLYTMRRLPFTPALVAICLSYCLFSNNTNAYRNFTTLFLAVLLIRETLPCYLFTAVLFLQELLNLLSKTKSIYQLGLFNPDSHSHMVLLMNILIVNLPVIAAMWIAFSHVRSRMTWQELSG